MSICTDNWAEVEAAAKLVLGEEIVAAIGQYRGQPHSESQLIAVLHQVQSRFGRLGGTHRRRVPTDADSGGQGGRRGQLLPFLPPQAAGPVH